MIIHKLEISPHENKNFRRLVLTSEKYAGLGQTAIEMIVSLETIKAIHARLSKELGLPDGWEHKFGEDGK